MNTHKAIDKIADKHRELTGPYTGPFDSDLEDFIRFKATAKMIFAELNIIDVPDTFITAAVRFLTGEEGD